MQLCFLKTGKGLHFKEERFILYVQNLKFWSHFASETQNFAQN